MPHNPERVPRYQAGPDDVEVILPRSRDLLSGRLPLITASIFALIIVAGSLLPTQTKHALHTQGVLHPWLHLIGFGVLALSLLSSTRSDLLRAVMVIGLLLLGYATEAVEGRRNHWGVEVRDVRTDSIGVLSGCVCSLLLTAKFRR